MSEVVSAIGKVEGLVDQRKVGNDIAADCALDHRPVLPRRIVRMGAMDTIGFRGLKRDQHFAAPAFDPADAAFPALHSASGTRISPGARSRASACTSRMDSNSSSNRTETRAATSPRVCE